MGKVRPVRALQRIERAPKAQRAFQRRQLPFHFPICNELKQHLQLRPTMAPQNQTEEAQVASPSNSKAPVPIKNALNLEVEHAKFEYPELLSTFPPTTDDPIPIVPYEDRALKANPTFKTLLGDATVTVTHLEPKTGTEISGLQLHELTDAQKDELALLIAHRGVVFFRGQKITADEMLELGSYYGPLHINLAHTKKDPELLVVENAVETSAAVLKRHKYDPVSTWHADVSYERQPPAYTLFKVLTTPEVGGDTLWASAYEAFDRLTPAFQRFVEGLVALHSGKVRNPELGTWRLHWY
jgi:sulfonate dioxygenase